MFEEMQALIELIESKERGSVLREIAERRLSFLGVNSRVERVTREPVSYRSATIADYSNEEMKAFQILPLRRTD